MEIIVETGAGIEGANSYNSLQEAVDFAAVRGLSLPCDTKQVKALSFRAMDYIESFEPRFGGVRSFAIQSTAYPRTGSYVRCEEFASNAIPKELKQAQIQTMIAIHAGFDPQMNVGIEPMIIEEMVGPLKIKYGKPGDIDGPAYDLPSLTAVNSLLKVLFSNPSSYSFVKV